MCIRKYPGFECIMMVYRASATIMDHEYANVKPPCFQHRKFSIGKHVEPHSIAPGGAGGNDAKGLIYSEGEQLHAVRGPAARSRVAVASASAGGHRFDKRQICSRLSQLRASHCYHAAVDLYSVYGFFVTKGKLQTTDNRSLRV